jgi:hypothetical protein
MHYSECTEIRVRDCSAWELELPTGPKKVILFAAGATFKEVLEYAKVHFERFNLSQITVGEMTFILQGSDQMYKADSRRFDQDGNSVPLH